MSWADGVKAIPSSHLPRYTERPAEVGIGSSVDGAGDPYGSAVAEMIE